MIDRLLYNRTLDVTPTLTVNMCNSELVFVPVSLFLIPRKCYNFLKILITINYIKYLIATSIWLILCRQR